VGGGPAGLPLPAALPLRCAVMRNLSEATEHLRAAKCLRAESELARDAGNEALAVWLMYLACLSLTEAERILSA
jgi:hypothetical protein